MKKIFALLAFLVCFATTYSQTAARWGMVPYGKPVPYSNPKLAESQLWYSTNESNLYGYNRLTARWEAYAQKSSYGEMSISNDTSTISFAATTAAPIQDLTAGPLSGFSMVSDSVLRYDGYEARTFSINYSATILFAEAANIITGYVEVNGSQSTRTKFRQTQTLVTENETVGGTALVTLQPGALIRFMFQPSAHTGTDILTIYQFNLNVVEVN